MNILVQQLPEAVEIDGKAWAINTDYRVALRVLLAHEDDELTEMEKQSILLMTLYPRIPTDIEEAIVQASKFMIGGKDPPEEDTAMRLYSFSKDADLIYAAFRQTHGIDLTTAELHWWAFLALFSDLGADTVFCNLAALRKRLRTGKATKEEREAASELGDLIEVPEPDTRTLEEKMADAQFMHEMGEI
jgi:hypothetical protein